MCDGRLNSDLNQDVAKPELVSDDSLKELDDVSNRPIPVVLLVALPLLLIWSDQILPPHLLGGRLQLIVEVLAVALGLVLFLVAWSTRRSEQPANLVLMSIGLLGVAVLDAARVVSALDVQAGTALDPRAIVLNAVADSLRVLALLAAALLPLRIAGTKPVYPAVVTVVVLTTGALAVIVMGPGAPIGESAWVWLAAQFPPDRVAPWLASGCGAAAAAAWRRRKPDALFIRVSLACAAVAVSHVVAMFTSAPQGWPLVV